MNKRRQIELLELEAEQYRISREIDRAEIARLEGSVGSWRACQKRVTAERDEAHKALCVIRDLATKVAIDEMPF